MADATDKLGMVIKNARNRCGMTRKELAAKVKISARYLMSIENGQYKPSYCLLFRLIRELCIPADTIFYPENSDTHSSIAQINAMLTLCSEKEVKIVLATLTVMLEANSPK